MKRRDRRWIAVIVTGLMVTTAGLPQVASAYPRPGRNVQVDLSYQGKQPECLATCNPSSHFPDVDRNGRYVAFHSHASNLVPGDTNLVVDVFVRDLVANEIVRASVASDGTQAVGLATDGSITSVSLDPSISASGRYVAFMSIAPNLAPSDTNQRHDAFVHDLKTGRTILASPGPDGKPAGISNAPKISADGKFVVFDAVRNDGVGVGPAFFGTANVYRFNLKTRKTQLVSKTIDGRACLGCFGASVSGDGRFVSFVSLDSTLVLGDTNGFEDLFVKDMKTGETVRASVASDGTQGLPPATPFGFTISGAPVMSDGGRFVLFASTFGNLVPNDTNYVDPLNSGDDVFVHDLKTRRTDRVTVTSYGGEAKGDSQHFEDISRDGRFILFGSGSNEFDGGRGTGWDLFVHDRKTGATTFVRPNNLKAYNSCAGNGALGRVGAISAEGRYAVFRGCGRMRPANSSGAYNLYRRDLGVDLGILTTPGARAPTVAGAPSFGERGFVAVRDDRNDANALVDQGGELLAAEVAFRPQYEDLFVRLKLKSMPNVVGRRAPTPGGVGYGTRFTVRGARYEVRGSQGSFRLLRCTSEDVCHEISRLRGAFGTTGVEVVFSIPVAEVGLEGRGRITDLEAFTFADDPSRSVIDLVTLGSA